MDRVIQSAITGVMIGLFIGALLNMQRALMGIHNSPVVDLTTDLPFFIQSK